MSDDFYVYIMASRPGGVLYVGVTSDLEARCVEHRLKVHRGFTRKYNVSRLVYFECFGDVYDAIAREKRIKGWVRRKKVALIERTNPSGRDLAEDWYERTESF